MVSITFFIVSRLNMDILTKCGTVRLAEQSINWSDYSNCINVHCNSPVWYHIVLFYISNRNNLVMYFFPIQVYQISDMIDTLWSILKIGTKFVNCLICNEQIVVSITFLIVSSLNMDIFTRFRTVRLAEQSIHWSDYGNCINVQCNSPVWYMC